MRVLADRTMMLQKLLLWLLIIAMLVKTSVLPCAAMSEISSVPSAVSTHQVDSHAQHQPHSLSQPLTQMPPHCAAMSTASSEQYMLSAELLVSDTPEPRALVQHDCHSCHSCGTASSMMVASVLLQTQLYPEIVPQFILPTPPLVWLALPLRPPKPVQNV